MGKRALYLDVLVGKREDGSNIYLKDIIHEIISDAAETPERCSAGCHTLVESFGHAMGDRIRALESDYIK